jgi:hypothetical protein
VLAILQAIGVPAYRTLGGSLSYQGMSGHCEVTTRTPANVRFANQVGNGPNRRGLVAIARLQSATASVSTGLAAALDNASSGHRFR